jgi:hypothetical protein
MVELSDYSDIVPAVGLGQKLVDYTEKRNTELQQVRLEAQKVLEEVQVLVPLVVLQDLVEVMRLEQPVALPVQGAM